MAFLWWPEQVCVALALVVVNLNLWSFLCFLFPAVVAGVAGLWLVCALCSRPYAPHLRAGC